MIPREILKKIRQIEIRTNRLVTELVSGARASARFIVRRLDASNLISQLASMRTLKRHERPAPLPLAVASFRSPAQFRRIPCAMPDGNQFNFAMLRIDSEINSAVLAEFNLPAAQFFISA